MGGAVSDALRPVPPRKRNGCGGRRRRRGGATPAQCFIQRDKSGLKKLHP
eukprot:gene1072-9486_t